MEAPAHGRRITIWLSAESYAFVEKFIEAGFAESQNGLIQVALEALGHEIKTSARNAAHEEGCPNPEYASLEELADMHQSEQRQDNQKH